MAERHSAATHHVPAFITAPGEADARVLTKFTTSALPLKADK
jgi:hypothetical protein